ARSSDHDRRIETRRRGGIARGVRRHELSHPPVPSIPAVAVDGVLGALGLFWLALFWLERTENLSPPAFSNNLCVDEKLDFLRSNPIVSPNLLVIGSSVAWRHVDGDALVREIPDANPLNGAFCGLFANQAVYVANWLLD